MKKVFLFVLILSFLIPNLTLAQFTVGNLPQQTQDLINQTPGLADELNSLYQFDPAKDLKNSASFSFSIRPTFPKPGELVTAEIKSFSIDLNRLQVSWFLNGTLQKREVGAKTFEFQMGELGKQTSLRISVLKTDGTTTEKTYNFRPAEVDIVYEALTYKPSLYEGKSYFSRQSNVIFKAIPQVLDRNGNYVKPENLVYKWYLDNDYIQNVSGYGKDTYFHQSKLLSRGVGVRVEISTIEDGPVANSAIFVSPQNPEVLVYEKSPTLGTLYNRIVSGLFSINKTEIEFEAVPFFFSTESVFSGNIVYDWNMNGFKINAPNRNFITFRNEKGEEGEANINISVSNNTVFQKGSSDFKLGFGQNNTTNEFGF